MQQKEPTAHARFDALTPEQIAQVKLLYDSGRRCDLIAEELGWSRMSFYRFRLEKGWPLRAAICRPAGLEGPPTGDALIPRLQCAIEREFVRVEKALNRTPDKAEVRARTLANMVKTFATLKQVRRADRQDPSEPDNSRANDANEPPPRKLAELRADLAQRLERMRNEGAFD